MAAAAAATLGNHPCNDVLYHLLFSMCRWPVPVLHKEFPNGGPGWGMDRVGKKGLALGLYVSLIHLSLHSPVAASGAYALLIPDPQIGSLSSCLVHVHDDDHAEGSCSRGTPPPSLPPGLLAIW